MKSEELSKTRTLHSSLFTLHCEMKRCPTCQRTYDDNMKFCQTDGTLLVTESQTAGDYDPYKTVVGNQSDQAASDFDPMQTMLNTPQTGGNQPSSSPFDNYNSPQSNEPKQSSGGFGNVQSTYQEPSSPFGNQQGFGQQDAGNWSAPPAPQGWGNQGLGQNTPFNAPPTPGVGQGQNNTLAIISLVTGILGLCCGLLGPVGFITGYIAKNNADQNPQMYGGRGLALAGMIIGGIATVLFILGIIIQILGLLARH